LNIPVWLSCPMDRLETADESEGARVTAVHAIKDGVPIRIEARRGVVLAAGGFGRSQEMREEYLPAPTSAQWTLSPDGQTGDAISAGVRCGAAVDLMDKVWGQPSALLPVPGAGEVPIFLIAERAAPGTIVVNGLGERYTNESAPYDDFYKAMYENNSDAAPGIPSWLLFDQTAKNRYMLLGMLPRQKFPALYFDSGFLLQENSLGELASRMGADPAVLERTVARFNELTQNGHDDDFGRGDSVYDRYYGDPGLPQPNLAPLLKPPFYAVKIFPCDLSTKGGLLVDRHSRVLTTEGTPINGLYATGNSAASLMGTTYVGPGATLGPAMVGGYSAVDHISSAARSDPELEVKVTSAPGPEPKAEL
jgi:3-oxosteroid 1-dehydrogenase